MVKVWTWGTFDCLHPGHTAFFRSALEYAMLSSSDLDCQLWVAVLPDDVVRASKRDPIFNEVERVEHVRALPYFPVAQVDCFERGLGSLLEAQPDFIYLGPDQDREQDLNLSVFKRQHGLGAVVIHSAAAKILDSTSLIGAARRSRPVLDSLARRTLDAERRSYRAFLAHMKLTLSSVAAVRPRV